MNKDITVKTTITIVIKGQEFQLDDKEANELLHQLKRALGDDKASYPYNPYLWFPKTAHTITPATIPLVGDDKYPPYTLPQTWCSTGCSTVATTTFVAN